MFTEIPIEVLRANVRAEPDGTLWWRTAGRNRRLEKQAFNTKTGPNAAYLCGNLHGVRLLAHRVVWALHYGEWPAKWVDHINRNTRDNRIENLRQADATLSNHNRDSRAKKGPYKGVMKDPNCNKFRAQIQCRGQHYYLGLYSTAEEAARVRDKKAKELYGENALLNFP
jgi:hypothetical protein